MSPDKAVSVANNILASCALLFKWLILLMHRPSKINTHLCDGAGFVGKKGRKVEKSADCSLCKKVFLLTSVQAFGEAQTTQNCQQQNCQQQIIPNIQTLCTLSLTKMGKLEFDLRGTFHLQLPPFKLG